jgi:hypothetical protein
MDESVNFTMFCSIINEWLFCFFLNVKILALNIMHVYVTFNHIGSVMVSMLALSAVENGFEPWSGQTKDYKLYPHS